MTGASRVKGWCPGALRPMESGDGLLVRLRITGGILPAHKAKMIAEAASTYGNGLIDLSGRANLQIRGVGATAWPLLIGELSRHGLIDTDAESEAVRNVMASPLAGLDPDALLDIRPLVKALEERLVTNHALHRLPAKFGFAVSDGGRFTLSNVTTDIGFEAIMGDAGPRFLVRLAGHTIVAEIGADQLVDKAEALALAFIKASTHSDKPIKRIKNLVLDQGVEPLFAEAGLDRLYPHPRQAETNPPFGYHRLGDSGFLSIAAPFGRWKADALHGLADTALKDGSGEIRLTPWRAILIPDLSGEAAKRLEDRLGLAFITKANDPRLAIAACSGHPFCPASSVATQEDALALASLAGLSPKSGIRLHVSGCEKGCARPETTEAVLVGREGTYDLVIAGKASDKPVRTGLDRQAAMTVLKALWAGEAI